MKHLLYTPLLLALLAGSALADEATHDVQGKPSPTLSDAIDNLEQENDRLQALLEQDSLDEEGYVLIHELSHTLENALVTIEEEVSATRSPVEQLRMGAENHDEARVREQGQTYLDVMDVLLRHHRSPEPALPFLEPEE